MEAYTVRRLYDVFWHAHENGMEILTPFQNDKHYPTFSKTFLFCDRGYVELRCHKKERITVTIGEKNVLPKRTLSVLDEPVHLGSDVDRPLRWKFDGFWQDIIHEYIEEVEADMHAYANAFNKEYRLRSILE